MVGGSVAMRQVTANICEMKRSYVLQEQSSVSVENVAWQLRAFNLQLLDRSPPLLGSGRRGCARQDQSHASGAAAGQDAVVNVSQQIDDQCFFAKVIDKIFNPDRIASVNFERTALLVAMALALTSCGGGDGGSGTGSTPPTANQAPQFNSASAVSVLENSSGPF